MRRLLLSWVIFIGNACADSDGVYCMGKDYVAIDARGIFLQAEGPTIVLVTINPAGSINRHVLSAPPNLNKSLRCEEDKIILSVGHMVDMSNFDVPMLKRIKIDENLNFSRAQLPYLEVSETIKLNTTDQSHLYSLVLDHNLQVPQQGMHLHHISARVVKVTKYGVFVSSELLAEGVRLETIH